MRRWIRKLQIALENLLPATCPRCGLCETEAFQIDCSCAWVDRRLIKYLDRR